MIVSAMVAMTRDGLIGDDKGLPWHLPADLRRFKEGTMGKPIVMGRKTHEFIGRVLPGRTNIVLTRNPATLQARPGLQVVSTPDEALTQAECLSDEIVIIGGAEIYRLFFPQVSRLYLTVIEGAFAGTTRFPVEVYDQAAWEILHTQWHRADERNPHSHTFYHLNRGDAGCTLTSILRPKDETQHKNRDSGQ
jgi:dihydrofolate reductase